jgi:hypothetical protein
MQCNAGNLSHLAGWAGKVPEEEEVLAALRRARAVLVDMQRRAIPEEVGGTRARRLARETV